MPTTPTQNKGKVILPSDSNTANVLLPLIPFNCIIDTDFGLLNLIFREYSDSDAFDPEFFKNRSIRNITRSLLNRKYENPLLLCLKDKNDLDSANELYNDFIDKKYEEILNLSMKTELYHFIKKLDIAGIKAYIVCESPYEISFLNRFKITKFAGKFLLSDADLSKFSQFYFKSINDIYITTLQPLIEKSTVYLASYIFNTDEEQIQKNKNALGLLMSMNKVYEFDIYNRNKLEEETINNE